MTTEKQNVANRLNARKSSGPRTKQGKARARLNALKFGMYSGELHLPGEDYDAFCELKSSLEKTFRPKDPIAWTYVTQIAGNIMRLKRVSLAEHSFYFLKVVGLHRENPDIPRQWLLGQLLTATMRDSSDYRDEKLRGLRESILRDLQRDIAALMQWLGVQAIELRAPSPRRLKGSRQLPEAIKAHAVEPKHNKLISHASKKDEGDVDLEKTKPKKTDDFDAVF